MILDLFHKEIEFNKIQGYDEIKDIVRRALDAEDNYNLLFIGPPTSAKSLFLLGILESRKVVYFDGSNTTNRSPFNPFFIYYESSSNSNCIKWRSRIQKSVIITSVTQVRPIRAPYKRVTNYRINYYM